MIHKEAEAGLSHSDQCGASREKQEEIWKEFVLMSSRTLTIKPHVIHVNLNYSNLGTNGEKGKEGKGKGRKVRVIKGKERRSLPRMRAEMAGIL